MERTAGLLGTSTLVYAVLGGESQSSVVAVGIYSRAHFNAAGRRDPQCGLSLPRRI